MAARIDAALRNEAAEPEDAAAIDDEPTYPEFVPPVPLAPVYAWPVHGLFVAELSYADFGDLGRSEGGTVALGKVLGSAEHPKLVQLRDCEILYRADAGERWLLRGHWYRFLESDEDVVSIITSVQNDPRIGNLQALQQAESAREVLFNPTRTAERLSNTGVRDYTNWP